MTKAREAVKKLPPTATASANASKHPLLTLRYVNGAQRSNSRRLARRASEASQSRVI
jgi:hypothetical protein